MEAEYRVASYLILGALGAFDLFLIVYCIYLISNGLRPVRRRFLSRGKVHDTLFLSVLWIILYIALFPALRSSDPPLVWFWFWILRLVEQYDRYRSLRRIHERWRERRHTPLAGPPAEPASQR
jgi:hypothetical protein